MDNGFIIISTFVLTTLVSSILHFYIYKSRKQDRHTLLLDWNNFLVARSNEDISAIQKHGKKLIFNKFLQQDQLTVITETVDHFIDNNPNLEELRLAALNKQLGYDGMPY